ncbi:hypothetical protein [Geomicrobium sp. JCM 19055]|uniref:hypothetical protein n=1 Tax=Geomicrobium sp. JCM 19055 TaxID=1460649 RepID=UPI00045ED1C8|nr:hypothetical protein [Geomicrobium sp. JCM 19055]GAK01367.1 hypothetical protein JCM19055_4526 [Geomicrobium sp. JCM 19055]
MGTLSQIWRDNADELVNALRVHKKEFIIAVLILIIASIAGALTSQFIDSGRNGIIRFYIGGIFTSFVLFSLYFMIDQAIRGRKVIE